MTWREGPLQSWYDIHEALRNEFPRLRRMADEIDPQDDGTLAALSDEVVFLADVLTVHSLSEDGVGFPILRNRGVDVPSELTADHHRELAMVYDIRRACLELRFHDTGQDIAPALQRVRELLETMEADLVAHIENEDERIIPAAAAKLSPEDQMHLVIKMVAHTPAWLSPRLLPWMVANISREHRLSLIKAWSKGMPVDIFAQRIKLLKQGLDPDIWTELEEALSSSAHSRNADGSEARNSQ